MNFLYDYFSISKCRSLTDRHLRLIRRIPGAAKYETNILASYNDLITKNNTFEAAIQDTYAAHDAVELYDTLMVAVVIKVHHQCEDYDTAHTGSFTRTTVFPKGNYSPITIGNLYKKPGKVAEIAQKLTALGTTHALYPLVAEINAAVTASNGAIDEEDDAIKSQTAAKSAAHVSHLQLIAKYNSNYHKAADEGGVAFAEQLFPKTRVTAKKETDTTTTTTETTK
jgi:hypothetical protein